MRRGTGTMRDITFVFNIACGWCIFRRFFYFFYLAYFLNYLSFLRTVDVRGFFRIYILNVYFRADFGYYYGVDDFILAARERHFTCVNIIHFVTLLGNRIMRLSNVIVLFNVMDYGYAIGSATFVFVIYGFRMFTMLYCGFKVIFYDRNYISFFARFIYIHVLYRWVTCARTGDRWWSGFLRNSWVWCLG